MAFQDLKVQSIAINDLSLISIKKKLGYVMIWCCVLCQNGSKYILNKKYCQWYMHVHLAKKVITINLIWQSNFALKIFNGKWALKLVICTSIRSNMTLEKWDKLENMKYEKQRKGCCINWPKIEIRIYT